MCAQAWWRHSQRDPPPESTSAAPEALELREDPCLSKPRPLWYGRSRAPLAEGSCAGETPGDGAYRVRLLSACLV